MAKKKLYSAAYRLFHYAYSSAAPEYYFHTDWDMTVKGVSVTGNQMADEGALFRMREGDCYPSFLAMVLGNGGRIQIHHVEDMVAIYEDIIEHLTDWSQYIERRFGACNNCPLEELKWFEQLAKAFHPHVDAYYREKKQNATQAMRFLGHGRETNRTAFIEFTPNMERRLRESSLGNRSKPKQGLLRQML